MSNPNSRCREAHGGKFTRPKAKWKGHARPHRPAFAHIAMPPQNMKTMTKAILGSGFGKLNFRRKAGGS